jgi:methylated-DNA-[protein]-cysteine S-methyltransferase
MVVTDFQEVSCLVEIRERSSFLYLLGPNVSHLTSLQRVYTLLLAIPPGRVTTYAHLARALSSSPRAVGGALRNNPFAPEVPCHRVIASDGYVGGFKGDWEKAPSGVNQSMKLQLLSEEGVQFTPDGKLIPRTGVWFDGPWDIKQARTNLKTISEREEVKG